MKMTLEITNPDDLLFVRNLLNGYGVVPTPETPTPDVAYSVNEGTNSAGEPAAPRASRGRKANGATEQPVEAEAAAPEPEAPVEQEAPPAPAEDSVNPFADVVEKKAKAAKKVSREDVNAAFQDYMTTFGQSAAMTDVVKVLEKTFGVKKIKDIPNTQEAFITAISTVKGVIDSNFFGRERI